MERDAKLYQDLLKVLVTREEIQAAVKALGEKITADYAGKEPVLIGILKGAVVFYSDLIREIDLPLTTEFMAISSYGSATKTSGVVQVLKDLNRDITGKDVMIVEDIVDSGMTLSYLKKYLADRGAASIRIVTLLDKPARRRVDLKTDYSCFTIPDEFVVGYGLDFAASPYLRRGVKHTLVCKTGTAAYEINSWSKRKKFTLFWSREALKEAFPGLHFMAPVCYNGI